MKLLRVGILAAVVIGLTCCADHDQSDPEYDTTQVLRVSLMNSGQIMLEGREANLAALDRALQSLRDRNGVVWCYREFGEQTPPAVAVEAMRLFTQYKRGVRVSRAADFSDYVDDRGNTWPKKTN